MSARGSGAVGGTPGPALATSEAMTRSQAGALHRLHPSAAGPAGSRAARVAPGWRRSLHPGTSCGFSLALQTPRLRSPAHSAQTSGLQTGGSMYRVEKAAGIRKSRDSTSGSEAGLEQARARSLAPPGENLGTAGPAVSFSPPLPPSMAGAFGGILFLGLFQALGIQQ